VDKELREHIIAMFAHCHRPWCTHR